MIESLQNGAKRASGSMSVGKAAHVGGEWSRRDGRCENQAGNDASAR